MTALEVALGGTTLFLALAVLVMATRDGSDREHAASLDEGALESSVGDAIADLELDDTAARIETHAREMKGFHHDVERLLRTPQHRGSFGEQQLEAILADQLPPDLFGTQEAVVGTNIPDAYVETADGIVPIDAKFPLEAYERAIGADDPEETARHEREFARRVEEQLSKIATEYVRPDEGTTEFAFAFVPSESVYYHLVTEEYDLLREFTGRGVLVVSPLTLGQKLELVKAGVHAQRLSAEALAVQGQLQRLGQRFEAFEDVWNTCVRHLSNAKDRADDADAAFDRLRSEFDRIDRLDAERDTPSERASDGASAKTADTGDHSVHHSPPSAEREG